MMRHRLPGLMALLCILFTSACGGDETCVDDSDCFAGEVCGQGLCEPAGTPNVSTANQGTNNATTANASTPNGSTPNGSTNSTTPNGSTNNTSPNNAGTSCLIDPFTATCEDDIWEENDEVDREVIPVDQTSWCTGGTIREMADFSGTLCAGDGLDTYRIMIDNRGPVCLTGPFTLRIEITLNDNCNPGLFRIEPYTFFDDPAVNDLCADDENVRCTSFDGGQRQVIEWRREADQINDFYLLIGSDDDNVQFDYDVSLTVVP